MTVFLISALRSVIELLGLCLLGQGILYVLAGRNRANNHVYQLFDLITKAPRQIVASTMRTSTNSITVGVLCFVILLLAWLGLALIRKSI
jgi:hypothetical protein